MAASFWLITSLALQWSWYRLAKKVMPRREMVLTEARAMVVREYLVENFGFDDSQLKTLGIGKQATTNSDSGWGTVQIIIYRIGNSASTQQSDANENCSS